MIVIKLMGGIGNQMFQYAFGLALSNNTSIQFKLDSQSFRDDPLRKYELENCFDLKNLLASVEEIDCSVWGTSSKKIIKIITLFKLEKFFNKSFVEPCFQFINPGIFQFKFKYFSGYWQSEKYFINYKDQILERFRFLYPLSEKYEHYKGAIVQSQSVSVHVRRGDYISSPMVNAFHGTCSKEYYAQAFSYIETHVPNPHFYIFSDDIEWCRRNFTGKNITFVEKGHLSKDWEDLCLMSLCRHNIIANSSFSWWGAWLNANNDKVVIAPKNWFVDKNISTSDLIPKDWIQF